VIKRLIVSKKKLIGEACIIAINHMKNVVNENKKLITFGVVIINKKPRRTAGLQLIKFSTAN
jgi:hypothetical protein